MIPQLPRSASSVDVIWQILEASLEYPFQDFQRVFKVSFMEVLKH